MVRKNAQILLDVQFEEKKKKKMKHGLEYKMIFAGRWCTYGT